MKKMFTGFFFFLVSFLFNCMLLTREFLHTLACSGRAFVSGVIYYKMSKWKNFPSYETFNILIKIPVFPNIRPYHIHLTYILLVFAFCLFLRQGFSVVQVGLEFLI